jgi:hypothetical protein
MKSINNVITPYGKGQLWDKLTDGMISVRLEINELTNTIPADRIVTKGTHTGLFKFWLKELK